MAGWVRSSFIVEGIQFPARLYDNVIQSERGFLHLQAGMWPPQAVQRTEYYSKGPPQTGIEFSVYPDFDEETFPWQWHVCGFHFGVGDRAACCCIPYWAITVPLTLISIWLILSMPHRSNQKKTPEPVPVDGA